MKCLKHFIDCFSKITTGIILVCAVMIKLAGVEQWTVDILWHIPLCGAATSLITVVLLPDRDFSRRAWKVRYCIHFVLVSAFIMSAGWLFGWYNPTFIGILAMMVAIAVVYAFAVITTYLSSSRSAEELNNALEARRKHGK